MTQTVDINEERQRRAQKYMEDASLARGVARSFTDIAEHLQASFTPGSDPARNALEATMRSLAQMREETLEYAANLETRAEFLKGVVTSGQ